MAITADAEMPICLHLELIDGDLLTLEEVQLHFLSSLQKLA